MRDKETILNEIDNLFTYGMVLTNCELYQKAILEVLLDIRDQNKQEKKQVKLVEDMVKTETKICHFCGADTVLIPVVKKVYICTKCGAEGKTLMSLKKEAKP